MKLGEKMGLPEYLDQSRYAYITYVREYPATSEFPAGFEFYLWKCRFCGRFLGKVDESRLEETAPCKRETCRILATLSGKTWI